MVGGWVFLLVPAHTGSPGQRAVKRLLLYVACIVVAGSVWDHQLGNVVSEKHESPRRSLHVEPRQEFRPRQGVDHLSRRLQPTVFKCTCSARCQFKVSNFADPPECTNPLFPPSCDVHNIRNLVNVGRWRNRQMLRMLLENMETKLYQWFLLVNCYGLYVKNRNRFYSYWFHVYVTFFAVYVKMYTWKFSRIHDFLFYLRYGNYLPTLSEGGNHK